MAEHIHNKGSQTTLLMDLEDIAVTERPIHTYVFNRIREEVVPETGTRLGPATEANNNKKGTVYYEAKMVEASHTYAGCMTIVLSDKTPMVELAEKKESESYVKKLVASITHDLRTPLNGIMGIVESLREFVGAEGKHFLQIITNTGTMMLYLINDVLDLAQIEANKLSLNKALFSPKDLIDETIQLMQFNFQQKNLSLAVRYVWNLPREINSDKTRYRQILLNLLGNALKFTRRGSVTVDVHYNLRFDTLITQVSDTGSGIAPDELPKLFQIFGRLESSRNSNPSGVGLGLHICKSLSQLLGGDIYVESELNSGSTFTFYVSCSLAPESEDSKRPCPTEGEIKDFVYHSRLNEDVEDEKSDHDLYAKAETGNETHQIPLVNTFKHSGQDTSAKSEPPQPPAKIEVQCDCARVLLVDDNQVNLFMLKSFLADIKSRVHVAYNGQEAVEKAMQKAKADCCKKYDVIYMDLNMPVMDGVAATIELTRLMKEGALSATPIIALSAESLSETEALDLCQQGFVSFLPKPISRAAFLDSVRKYSPLAK